MTVRVLDGNKVALSKRVTLETEQRYPSGTSSVIHRSISSITQRDNEIKISEVIPRTKGEAPLGKSAPRKSKQLQYWRQTKDYARDIDNLEKIKEGQIKRRNAIKHYDRNLDPERHEIEKRLSDATNAEIRQTEASIEKLRLE